MPFVHTLNWPHQVSSHTKNDPILYFLVAVAEEWGVHTLLFSEGNCQKLESKRQSQNQIECSLSDQCCRSKEVKNLISDIEKSFIVDLHFSGSDICQFAFELLTFSLSIVWRQFRCALSNPSLLNSCQILPCQILFKSYHHR